MIFFPMYNFIIYQLKAAIILAVFYLCFKFFLSHEKMHRVNRIVLVATAILSFILPLCIITIHKTVPMPENPLMEIITESEISTVVTIENASTFSWEILIIGAYWIGVIFVLVSILVGIYRVMKLIRSGEIKSINSTKVIICEGGISPFSWMKWIVMCKSDFESGNHHILEHEKAHIRLGHSKEVLLFDILSAFQWFNPAIWLLKRDLRAIHEYEADDAVLREGANIKEYQYSLIRKAVSASGYSITNSFNHSILKNRITMMSKSKSSGMRWLRALYILPLICGALALNARTITDYKVSENYSNIVDKQQDSTAADNDGSNDIQSKEEQFTRIEVKQDSNGDIQYSVLNSEVLFDDIANDVSSLIKNDDVIAVEIVAQADLKYGIIHDLKEVLRKLPNLKVKYICPDIESVSRNLTQSKEIADKSGIKLVETWEEIQSEPKENRHYVRINKNDQVLFDSSLINIEDIMGLAAEVRRSNHQAIIFYQVDVGTSYGAFVTAQKKISDAVTLVRNEYSNKQFGKPFDNLDEEELNVVIKEIPLNISEITPKRL